LASTPKLPLPKEVTERPKTGFVVPVKEWLTGPVNGGKTETGWRTWARTLYSHHKGLV
jgi:asparagine synthase (glutamine-hydrolysing)